ncbi:MAG: site-2 protease family protein [Planctomycetota bacterium]
MNAPTDADAATALRLRADLRWRRCRGPLADRWRVKDPLSLDYHEFGADERFLLDQFDGRSTIAQIKRRYEHRFAPKQISPQRLHQFAAEAHARGLLLAGGVGQGEHLLQRSRFRRRREAWSRVLSLLCVRLPGFDPNGLLDRLLPATRWFWRPATIVCVLLTALITAGVLAGRAGELAARLPASQDFLQAGNVAMLLLAFIAVKGVHELAHGLACRHVGARCHEMGVMLIALAPCFYCDVTDLWMTPSRWKRMLVSAAGMYAELAIAIVSAWLWMLCTDGLVGAVLLNLMLACGVSTLLFNANPLLKLDGYFLLSDATATPNLHQRARRALTEPLAAWLRGRAPAEGAFSWPLAGYAAASLAYRAAVVVVLLAAAHHLLTTWGLRPVGDVVAASTALGLLVAGVMGVAPLVGSPLARRSLRWGRVACLAALAGGVVAAVLMWPLPHSVRAPAVFQLRGAQPVAAAVPGRLEWAAAEGDRVQAGQAIARLANAGYARRRAQLAGELDRHELRLSSLRRRAPVEPGLAAQLPTAESAVQRARADLSQLDTEIESLTLRSPGDGVVVQAAARLAQPGGARLPAWQGDLLAPANRGAWVAVGDVVALVAPSPDQLEATLLVDQGQSLGIRPGVRGRVLADQAGGAVAAGVVQSVSRSDFDELPEVLRRHPELLTSRPQPGTPRVVRPVLLATMPVAAQQLPVGHGSHGLCRIELPAEPLGATLWRWLAQTFPLRLSR